MRIPTVAIIGRPNTGKSTLFNRLTRSRKAIVSPFAGTTRDHVAQRVDDETMSYLLLDTGGIGGGSDDKDLEEDVSAQSMIALGAADLILFTVNIRDELTASDRAVAELLRKKRKRHVPVVIVATKCDGVDDIDARLSLCHELQIADEVIAVSAAHGTGDAELRDLLASQLRELHFTRDTGAEKKRDVNVPRIAIIGKPNVGKSSLVNALMSDPQRELSPRLVSDIPGTTRDASDTVIRHNDKEYIFIDTAGLRRQARVEEEIEEISVIKSMQALEEADIAVLVVSAIEPVSKQDKRIVNMAMEQGKGIVVLVNKCDLLSTAQKEEKRIDVGRDLHFCRFAPVLFVSATTRDGLVKVFPLIETVARNRLRRITPKDLRRWFDDAVQRIPPSAMTQAKHVTQAADLPPTFVLFVGNPKAVLVSQLKYLENALRDTFAFEGTPIRWITKSKRPEEEE